MISNISSSVLALISSNNSVYSCNRFQGGFIAWVGYAILNNPLGIKYFVICCFVYFYLFIYLFIFFETEFHVTQAGLELPM